MRKPAAGGWVEYTPKLCFWMLPPLAAMMNKEMVNLAFETTLDQGLQAERRMFQILVATEDKAEGMAAFVEKRAGVWQNK